MVDAEVERLRRLRRSALRLRAVARALGKNKWTRNSALLSQGRCAAWRVARIVSGRLRAHPYVPYQQDARFATLLNNSLAATALALTVSSRQRALRVFEAQLKAVMRELDDARSFTSAADLSDTFGRSQKEFRTLIAAVHSATHDCGDAMAVAQVPRGIMPAGGWPFLNI